VEEQDQDSNVSLSPWPARLGHALCITGYSLVWLLISQYTSTQGRDLHPSKKRRTPPISSEPSHQDSETPRVGQIQKKVEEMKVNRISGGPYYIDPINGLTKPPTDGLTAREQEPEKEKDAVDQPPSTPNKEEQAKSEKTDPENQEIETDDEEPMA